jgi:GH25 family lysozyme M1 (1,4-beta-N-acetylmuramidase)
VSTDDASSNGHSDAEAARRDLRDRPFFRIAVLLVVLIVAFVSMKSCSRQQYDVSQDEAVTIARKHIDFTPDDYQVKYLPQGIPPVYYWAVNFYEKNAQGQVTRTEVVLVNATTGEVQP